MIIDSQTKFDKVLETILDPNTAVADKKLEAEIILSDLPKPAPSNPFLLKASEPQKLFENLIPEDAGN